MPLQSGIYPSTTVSFIVKNNSSINRTIKVFGVKLNPGQTVDLMTIPGVTEEDIRSELTKGSLKSLFVGKSLTIVSSTINFSTVDPSHNAFLNSIGIINQMGGYGYNTITQTVFIVDPLSTFGSANDLNDGLTNATPIKTLSELSRRLSGLLLTKSIFVTLNSSAPAGDYFAPVGLQSIIIGVSTNFQIFVNGTPTVFRTGTMTISQAENPAANQELRISDAGGIGAADIGKLLIDTAVGANFGSCCWVSKDRTGNVVQGSSIRSPFATNSGSLVGTAGTFTTGDTYSVNTLPRINVGPIDARSAILGSIPIVFQYLDVWSESSNSTPSIPNLASFCSILFHSCFFDSRAMGGMAGLAVLTNCWVASGSVGVQGTRIIYFAGVMASTNLFTPGDIFLGGNIYVLGPILTNSGATSGTNNIYHGAVALMNIAGDGITIQFGSRMYQQSIFADSALLWGTGTTGVAINIHSDSSYVCSTKPIVTGTADGSGAGDFKLGGLRTFRTWNEAGGVYTAPANANWSNVTTHAKDVASNAAIYVSA